jgi:hypothetical protein
LVGRSVRGLPDALAACDAVQIVESADPYVSVRYDRVMNGLERFLELVVIAEPRRTSPTCSRRRLNWRVRPPE